MQVPFFSMSSLLSADCISDLSSHNAQSSREWVYDPSQKSVCSKEIFCRGEIYQEELRILFPKGTARIFLTKFLFFSLEESILNFGGRPIFDTQPTYLWMLFLLIIQFSSTSFLPAKLLGWRQISEHFARTVCTDSIESMMESANSTSCHSAEVSTNTEAFQRWSYDCKSLTVTELIWFIGVMCLMPYGGDNLVYHCFTAPSIWFIVGILTQRATAETFCRDRGRCEWSGEVSGECSWRLNREKKVYPF